MASLNFSKLKYKTRICVKSCKLFILFFKWMSKTFNYGLKMLCAHEAKNKKKNKIECIILKGVDFEQF